MAQLVQTNKVRRHVIGDLAFRRYSVVGSGTTGDTLVVPQTDIEIVLISPTTSVSVGVTTSPGPTSTTTTLTFTIVGAWTAVVVVISRVG